MYGAVNTFNVKKWNSVGIGISDRVNDIVSSAVGIVMIEIDDGDIIPIIDGFIFGYARVEDGDHSL